MSDKFTFKKEPCASGLYSVGNPYPNVIIKHDKLKCGTIYAPSWNAHAWRVALTFRGSDGNPNCDWHWEEVKICKTEEEARAYLQKNVKKFIARELHHFEPTDG